MPSRRSKAGISGPTGPLGKRSSEGASEMFSASFSVSRRIAPSLGAAT